MRVQPVGICGNRARLQGAKGFLLWNATGVYTKAALAPETTGLSG